MKVKICGLKRQQDVEYVNCLKPDYAGFILAPSKRRISLEECKSLIGGMEKDILKVGVFVNTPTEEINDIMAFAGLDIAQLHGEERPEECRKIERPVWKSFRIRDEKSLKPIHLYSVDGCLLDAYHKEQHGGTGKSFKWDLIKNFPLPPMTILAGGIHIYNIGAAMKLPGVGCMDVSSGVESLGAKDFCKMKEIIEKVRMHEQ